MELVRVYVIPAENLEGFLADVEKINKRAKRWSGKAIETKVLDYVDTPMTVTGRDGVKREYVQRYYNVQITGENPKIHGWEFIAKIDHTTEGGNFVRVVPGKTLPAHYRDAACVCDHCQTQRYRKDTFILFNEEKGEHKQVGRQCVRDFIGYDVDAMARYAEYLACLDEVSERFGSYDPLGGSRPTRFSLDSLLAMTAAVIDKKGWVSRSKARESYPPVAATVDLALTCLFPNPISNADYELRAEIGAPTAVHEKMAAKAAEMAQEITDEQIVSPRTGEFNDYQHNIRVVARSGVVEFKTAGIAASIIKWMERELNKQAAKEFERLTFENSTFVGKEKDRIDFRLRMISVVNYSNDFGPVWKYTFADENGNMFIWYSSNDEELVRLNWYIVTGTVRKHDVTRGEKPIKHTVINRCKAMDAAHYDRVVVGFHLILAAMMDAAGVKAPVEEAA